MGLNEWGDELIFTVEEQHNNTVEIMNEGDTKGGRKGGWGVIAVLDRMNVRGRMPWCLSCLVGWADVRFITQNTVTNANEGQYEHSSVFEGRKVNAGGFGGIYSSLGAPW